MRLNGLNTLSGSVFKKAKLCSTSFVSNSVVLLVSDFPHDGLFPYIGFIVTKKNGSAVKRNFIKRRLRAVATKIIAKFADKMKAYILIPRSNLVCCLFSELEKDILYCLRNAKNKK